MSYFDRFNIKLKIFHIFLIVSQVKFYYKLNLQFNILPNKFIFIEFIIKNNRNRYKYSTFTPIKWSHCGQQGTTTGRMTPSGSK